MNYSFHKPEILAPGGSIDSIYAAINAGCDAVYVGGSRYGARAFADNPDDDALVSVIDDVHFYDKKIYITVNTVLTQNEFKGLYSFIDKIYTAGADAVIVQDLGVLKFIHDEFPCMQIHASTQMNIMQANVAELLKSYGVTRIVPARELSFSELKKMRAETGLELEVFVQGALCYSHSGQCLMSSLIGGRSGNRGACAQPCRKMYTSKNADSYLLSLKDLCTLNHIPELVSAGIDSFKIEGRMKKPEYAAFTSHLYRKYVDIYFENNCDRNAYEEAILKNDMLANDIHKLKDVYNRGGFTCGYLLNDYDRDIMLSGKRANHEGVKVGKVCNVLNDKKQVRLLFDSDVNASDVLEIRDVYGKTVHEHTIKNDMPTSSTLDINAGYNFKKIDETCEIFRVRNESLIREIENKYTNELPKVNISGSFVGLADNEAELSVWLTERPEIVVSVKGDMVSKANNRPSSEQDVSDKIKVSGNTKYVWDELLVTIDDDVFLPAGMLKKMRREAFDMLYLETVNVYHREPVTDSNNNSNTCIDSENMYDKTHVIAEIKNEEQFNVVAGSDVVNTIYIHVEDLSYDSIKLLISQTSKDIYIVMPRIFRYEQAAEFDKEYDINVLISYDNFKGFVVCNLEELCYLNEKTANGVFEIRSADNLYVRNEFADTMLKENNISLCAPSIECTKNELSRFTEGAYDIVLYKRATAMITSICMDGTDDFYDSYGNRYVVKWYDKYIYSEIYHYEIYDLINEMDVKNIPFVRLAFTLEDASEVKEVINRLKKRL
ncbi:MAG: U32 family peptidase [Lachnospiraceae bacterium]|nr:U32 family peptidase [Lachnospiraceae bacterium]